MVGSICLFQRVILLSDTSILLKVLSHKSHKWPLGGAAVEKIQVVFKHLDV